MASPFPGMDPYIETCGLRGDFHNALIAEIQRALSEQLPPGYVARTGKRSSTEFVEKFLDIYELHPERRLVTSIEVLSPSNKRPRSPGCKKYLRKRQALLLGKANLVEIDLLRGGARMPMLDPLPDSPYYVLVCREDAAPRCQVWRASFDRPLPPLTVPLSSPDPDVTVALQLLVTGIYERSRYREDIDYTQPLTPPFTADEAAWFSRQLRAGGSSRPSRRRSPPRT